MSKGSHVSDTLLSKWEYRDKYMMLLLYWFLCQLCQTNKWVWVWVWGTAVTSPTTALQDGAADADDVATRVRQVSQLAPKTFRAPVWAIGCSKGREKVDYRSGPRRFTDQAMSCRARYHDRYYELENFCKTSSDLHSALLWIRRRRRWRKADVPWRSLDARTDSSASSGGAASRHKRSDGKRGADQ